MTTVLSHFRKIDSAWVEGAGAVHVPPFSVEPWCLSRVRINEMQ